MTLLELLVKELPKRGGWPEGAKVCCQSEVDFELYFSGDCNWRSRIYLARAEDNESAAITRDQYEAALAAPRQPVWGGEGLPPVGCLVELMDDSQSMTWGNATIKFYGDSFAVWDDNGEECSNSLCHVKVRPIRTDAERKREETVKVMRTHTTNYNKTDVIHAIGEIYDAIASGKIPGVKLDT